MLDKHTEYLDSYSDCVDCKYAARGLEQYLSKTMPDVEAAKALETLLRKQLGEGL